MKAEKLARKAFHLHSPALFLLWLNTVLGVVLALTPFVLFPVCAELKPDGTPMKCWYSGIFITIMGIAAVAFALLSILGKLPVVFTILSAAAALMCWLVPNGIIGLTGENWACGLCADPSHACRAVTLPALGTLVVAIVIVSVAALIFMFVQPALGRMSRR